MDAISLLMKDHRAVEALFKQFDKLGEGAAKEKRQLVQQITRELSIHAAIEEEIMYPAARSAVKSAEDDVLEALEEHHVVKWLLSELESLSPTSERYDAKVTVLKEAVQHHVEEEEQELFPMMQKKLDKEALNALGKALESAKKLAPTHPHPRAPDSPPGNLLAGLPAAMLDRVRDLVSGVAKRGAEAKKDGKSTNGKSTNGKSTSGRTTKAATSARSAKSRASSSSARPH